MENQENQENQEIQELGSYKNEPRRPIIKPSLPNATAVLVLGIISIPTSFCYGVVGVTTGIIALVLAKKDLKLYNEFPDQYGGYDNLNIGRICAIIGLSIGSLFLLLFILYIVFAISIFVPLFSAASAT